MKAIVLSFSILLAALMLLGWSSPVDAANASTSCKVTDVATFGDRVHIHCADKLSACSLTPAGCGQAAQNDINYFAVETGSPMASNVAQAGLAALANSRKLEIDYDDNPGANPAGCQQNDCRRITGVIVR